MLKTNFSINLRAVCDKQTSVAQVCRSLGMNRQQFNKYLSGQVFPSSHNLVTICDYFAISKDDFLLTTAEFRQFLSNKTEDASVTNLSHLDRAVDSLPNNIEAMERYEGFYHGYYHALGFPGYIVRSIIQVYRNGDRFYSKNIEHLWDKSNPKATPTRFKYQGVLHYLGDRIFLTEYEQLAKQTITHTIIIPSYRNTFRMLSGLTLGVGSVNSHLPKATRSEYEFLGKQINLRAALTNCGLYHHDSEEIEADIRNKISNQILPHEYMLSVID